MRIDVLSIFPEMFEPVLSASVIGKARAAGLVDWRLWDIRDFADNKHDKVDDRPFGGGPGMVMYPEPIFRAVHAAEREEPGRRAVRLLMSPQGERLTQEGVEKLAACDRLVLIAGHYEGVDERAIEALGLRELSIGDYVLSGGELPAMVLIDSIVRLRPGVLGHEQSAAEDSFSAVGSAGERLLDCPHYTRPREWRGMGVPEVLLGGDHGAVARWRDERRVERTRERRPDLLDGSALGEGDS